MKTIRYIVVIAFLGCSASLLVLQSRWGKDLAVNYLRNALQASGYQAEIDKFSGTVPHAIHLEGVRIVSDHVAISIHSIDMRLSLFALLKKELLFTDVKASDISWETKMGALEQKGLKLTLTVKHFTLTNVHLQDQTLINLDGSLRIGKNSRSVDLDIFATRPSFPESKIHLTLHRDKQGNLLLKGNFKSPTLTALPLPPLPFDASADISMTMRGKIDHLMGRISGTFSPDSLPYPWLEKQWKIHSHLTYDAKTGWSLSAFNGAADHNLIQGSAAFNRQGQFENADLDVQSNLLHIKLNLKPEEEGIRVIANASLPTWQIESIPIENIQAHTEFLWSANTFEGKGTAEYSIYGKSWKGDGDFFYTNGDSLFLNQVQLESASAKVFGNLEIRPDKILIGKTDVTFENLSELPFDLHGKLEGKIDWFQSIGKQVITIDAEIHGCYWKDCFTNNLNIEASLLDPFEHPQGRIVLNGADGKWHDLFLNHFRFETFIGSAPQWPFAFSALGKWKHPLSLDLNGSWHYQAKNFAALLQTVDGSFYNHLFTLKHPVDIEYSDTRVSINGLDLDVSDARLYFQMNGVKNDFTSELILEHFPLDVLSLNPLEVDVEGTLDCKASLHEKNGKTQGQFHAAIHQVELLAGEPLSASGSASGQFDGRLENERLELQGALLVQETPLLSLDVSLPLELHLMPPKVVFPVDQKVKGHLAFNGRVEQILDFFDLGTHRIEGEATADFQLKNTLQKPMLKGMLHFEKGYYENYLTGTRLFDISAEANADGDRLLLRSFQAQGETGSITATGVMTLSTPDFFPFTLDLSLNRFQAVQIDLVNIETEGKIQILGNAKGATAKGSLEVIESHLHIPSRIPRSLPNLVVVYRNAAKPTNPTQISHHEPYPLQLDLQIRAPQGILIDGRGLNSEWKGDFHIGGAYTSVAALGTLKLIKGEFLFSGRRFKLLEGSLNFSGKHEEMPYLNLAAEINVKGISITARLKGPLNNPQLVLQSTPPLPLSTIMSYLLFGQELAEINSFQALQLANSLASFAGNSPDILENTRKALGVDRLNIVSIPSGNEEIENVIALQVGKYVSEGVLVSLTQGAEDASSNINIEIELKNGFTIQLESDQRQEQGKFSVKWNQNY
ncbi:MAG TPA: translocation/assembly module TamB [Chlamydiales bacterium]|nr:translocation/assembly module TamB [Chlamydiales bacterium]